MNYNNSTALTNLPESSKKGKGKEVDPACEVEVIEVIEIVDDASKEKEKMVKSRGRPKGQRNHASSGVARIEEPGKYNFWYSIDTESLDQVSSETRLINFFFENGGLNIRKYLGSTDNKSGGKAGETKDSVLGRCVTYFHEAGVHYRTKAHIKSKVNGLLASYREAHRIDTKSGEGSMGDDDQSGKAEFEGMYSTSKP